MSNRELPSLVINVLFIKLDQSFIKVLGEKYVRQQNTAKLTPKS